MIINIKVLSHYNGAKLKFQHHSCRIHYEAIFTFSDDQRGGDILSLVNDAAENFKHNRSVYPFITISIDHVILHTSAIHRIYRVPRLIYGYVEDWLTEGNREYISAPIRSPVVNLILGVHTKAFVDSQIFRLIQASAIHICIDDESDQWNWIEGVKNPFVKRVYVSKDNWNNKPAKRQVLTTLLSQLPSLEKVIFEKGSVGIEGIANNYDVGPVPVSGHV